MMGSIGHHLNPRFGKCAIPGTGLGNLHSSRMRPRDILAANVKALMDHHEDLGTLKKLVARTGIPNGTLDRIRRALVGCSIDHLGALADAFDLQPWHLLLPNLDVENPQVLAALSTRERDLYDRLRSAAQELSQLPSSTN